MKEILFIILLILEIIVMIMALYSFVHIIITDKKLEKERNEILSKIRKEIENNE